MSADPSHGAGAHRHDPLAPNRNIEWRREAILTGAQRAEYSIDQLDHHTAVTSRNDTATRATGHRIAGLHLERQATSPVLRDREQMEAGEVE